MEIRRKVFSQASDSEKDIQYYANLAKIRGHFDKNEHFTAGLGAVLAGGGIPSMAYGVEKNINNKALATVAAAGAVGGGIGGYVLGRKARKKVYKKLDDMHDRYEAASPRERADLRAQLQRDFDRMQSGGTLMYRFRQRD